MITKIVALADEEGVVRELALFADTGAFVRDDGDWLPVTEDSEERIDGLTAVDAGQEFVPLFDMAETTDATLTVNDVV